MASPRCSALLVLLATTASVLISTGISASSSVTLEQIGPDITGASVAHYLGESVALDTDGDVMAVGTPGHSGTHSQSGLVTVYARTGTGWAPMGSPIEGAGANEYIGRSVSLSLDGNTLAIGSANNDGGGRGAGTGHVRVFGWDGSNWIQRGPDINGLASEAFGHSVALSLDGSTLAVGATTPSGGFKGKVRIFDRLGNHWFQRGADIDGSANSDLAGWSIALTNDGDTVAIGAVGRASSTGQVRVYTWDGNNWTQRGADIGGEAAGDLAGHSISLSGDGNTIAISAPWNDGGANDAGQVRVYAWGSNNWVQRGNDIDGRSSNEFSGWSVSLDDSGSRVAIGSPGSDGNNAPTIRGIVRLYEWDGSTWSQLGSDLDDGHIGDFAGKYIAFSADSHTLVIGAPRNNEGGWGSGKVRSYRLTYSTTPSTPNLVPEASIHRADLDPNGGVCVDSASHTSPWTSVFIGYRYLPNAADCTRPGHIFTGWADRSSPSEPIALPSLVDPLDGEHRSFLAGDADLIAIWTPLPPAITDLTVFANFLCGPCTTIWVFHTTPPAGTNVDFTIDGIPTICSQNFDALGLSFCEITPLTPGSHSLTASPRRPSADGIDLFGATSSIPFQLHVD